MQSRNFEIAGQIKPTRGCLRQGTGREREQNAGQKRRRSWECVVSSEKLLEAAQRFSKMPPKAALTGTGGLTAKVGGGTATSATGGGTKTSTTGASGRRGSLVPKGALMKEVATKDATGDEKKKAVCCLATTLLPTLPRTEHSSFLPLLLPLAMLCMLCIAHRSLANGDPR